jgi:hypothetical protein
VRQQCLETITIHLPKASEALVEGLFLLLGDSATKHDDVYTVAPSSDSFLPKISIDSDSSETFAKAEFKLMNNDTLSVYIINITGVDKQNPTPFRHVELEDVTGRFIRNGIGVVGIDHIGFNLPWFNNGIHPAIADLRSRLRAACLYHLFPTGEPWDFILPGELAEISKRRAVDYSRTRKPKFELVSFDKASIPLVQIDIAVDMKYSDFRTVFPEALDDLQMKSIWVYLQNSYDLDICLVINESKANDWSTFFSDHRLR